jgi:hypothetical protein
MCAAEAWRHGVPGRAAGGVENQSLAQVGPGQERARCPSPPGVYAGTIGAVGNNSRGVAGVSWWVDDMGDDARWMDSPVGYCSTTPTPASPGTPPHPPPHPSYSPCLPNRLCHQERDPAPLQVPGRKRLRRGLWRRRVPGEPAAGPILLAREELTVSAGPMLPDWASWPPAHSQLAERIMGVGRTDWQGYSTPCHPTHRTTAILRAALCSYFGRHSGGRPPLPAKKWRTFGLPAIGISISEFHR